MDEKIPVSVTRSDRFCIDYLSVRIEGFKQDIEGRTLYDVRAYKTSRHWLNQTVEIVKEFTLPINKDDSIPQELLMNSHYLTDLKQPRERYNIWRRIGRAGIRLQPGEWKKLDELVERAIERCF